MRSKKEQWTSGKARERVLTEEMLKKRCLNLLEWLNSKSKSFLMENSKKKSCALEIILKKYQGGAEKYIWGLAVFCRQVENQI